MFVSIRSIAVLCSKRPGGWTSDRPSSCRPYGGRSTRRPLHPRPPCSNSTTPTSLTSVLHQTLAWCGRRASRHAYCDPLAAAICRRAPRAPRHLPLTVSSVEELSRQLRSPLSGPAGAQLDKHCLGAVLGHAHYDVCAALRRL